MQEFFLILIVVFLLFRILRPAFFISINRFPGSHPGYRDRHQKKEGETSIEHSRPHSPSKKDEGEYVDYEEVK
jgi:hypothetical protein